MDEGRSGMSQRSFSEEQHMQSSLLDKDDKHRSLTFSEMFPDDNRTVDED